MPIFPLCLIYIYFFKVIWLKIKPNQIWTNGWSSLWFIGGNRKRRCTFVDLVLHERDRRDGRSCTGAYQKHGSWYLDENEQVLLRQLFYAVLTNISQMYHEWCPSLAFHLPKWRRIWGSGPRDSRPSHLLLDWTHSSQLINY